MGDPTEVWKKILEFPSYEVNAVGQVRNRNTNRILKPQKNGTGGFHVSLREGHETSTRSVNALRRRAFGNSS